MMMSAPRKKKTTFVTNSILLSMITFEKDAFAGTPSLWRRNALIGSLPTCAVGVR